MRKEFTPDAKKKWESYPEEGRERIVKYVFCVRCLKGVEMIDYGGEIDDGVLVLHGTCKTCGQNVARVVDEDT